MAKKLILDRFMTYLVQAGGVDSKCSTLAGLSGSSLSSARTKLFYTLAELGNLANSLDDLEWQNFQNISGRIDDQKGAQNAPHQIEIKLKTCIQISLDDRVSQWVGIAIFHTSPQFRRNTISSPDGQCPFTLQGPGGLRLKWKVEESANIGPVFIQAVELNNQDHVDVSLDVLSSHDCNNGKRSEARKWEIYVFPMGANPATILEKCGLQKLFQMGFNLNIQVVTCLRSIHRTLKRPRTDFPVSTFTPATSEHDDLLKKAKCGYAKYLDTLNVNSLKIEASRWD